VSGDLAWDERETAVDVVRSSLEPRLDALRSSRVESGTVYQVGYNQTAAEDWRRENCPVGPDRQFGDCEAREGVAVQERVGETHVLAVAFDVRVTTERESMALTLVVESIDQ
jgi:hypothetical protein